MEQQKLEDALREAQKPLARHYDDEDLDRMLREQEREGDPMAAMLRRKKDRNVKTQGVKHFINSTLVPGGNGKNGSSTYKVVNILILFCRKASV